MVKKAQQMWNIPLLLRFSSLLKNLLYSIMNPAVAPVSLLIEGRRLRIGRKALPNCHRPGGNLTGILDLSAGIGCKHSCAAACTDVSFHLQNLRVQNIGKNLHPDAASGSSADPP